MFIIKQKIANNFDRATNTYEDAAVVQKMASNLLINQLHEFEPDLDPKSIMDLGTGTGLLTETLYQTYPKASFTLNDISPHMLDKAKDKFKQFSNFKFILGDMENIDFAEHDLVISNLSLQWLTDLEVTIKNIFNKTKFLAFSCLLDGNFDEWYAILQDFFPKFVIPKFPESDHLNDFLKNLKPAKFITYVEEFKLLFPDPKSTMIYLKDLGAQTSVNSVPINIIKNLMQNYKKEVELNYKIFFAILEK